MIHMPMQKHQIAQSHTNFIDGIHKKGEQRTDLYQIVNQIFTVQYTQVEHFGHILGNNKQIPLEKRNMNQFPHLVPHKASLLQWISVK